jgi:hypothetical protein
VDRIHPSLNFPDTSDRSSSLDNGLEESHVKRCPILAANPLCGGPFCPFRWSFWPFCLPIMMSRHLFPSSHSSGPARMNLQILHRAMTSGHRETRLRLPPGSYRTDVRTRFENNSPPPPRHDDRSVATRKTAAVIFNCLRFQNMTAYHRVVPLWSGVGGDHEARRGVERGTTARNL